MKRDCGKGELVPYRYEIVHVVGRSDKEFKTPVTATEADAKFEEILSRLIPYSNIMLYALDKQGYANCIRSVWVTQDGKLSVATDRRSEL